MRVLLHQEMIKYVYDFSCFIFLSQCLILQWSDQINDDTGNSGYLCAGGAINNGNSGNFQLPFVGIVNQISFYATTLLSAA